MLRRYFATNFFVLDNSSIVRGVAYVYRIIYNSVATRTGDLDSHLFERVILERDALEYCAEKALRFIAMFNVWHAVKPLIPRARRN